MFSALSEFRVYIIVRKKDICGKGLAGLVFGDDLGRRSIVFQHITNKIITPIIHSSPNPSNKTKTDRILFFPPPFPYLSLLIIILIYCIVLMRKLNDVVQYDFERNTFYRINKQTGVESPTYKTGQNMKKFKPDVTGHSYLIRRKSQREEPVTEMRIPNERSFRTERIPPEYSYFKTIESSRRESKATQASILMRSTISKRKDPQQKSKDRENAFLNMHEESSAISQQKQSKELMNQTLTSYTKLLKEKVRENHSPKRDQYEGSQTARDPLDTLCTTLSHFRTKQPKWQSQTTPPQNRPQRATPPLQFDKKQRTSKQRSLFLDFHPEFQTIANPSRLQAQVQRKRNLKILQELFISQGNKQTRKAYQSTA